MIASTFTPSFELDSFDCDCTWNELYTSLFPLARYLVYSFHLASWRGQENDVIDDIMQETMRRFLERERKARRGEAESVHSPKEMIAAIAKNYCRDLRRSERKVSRWMPQESMPDAEEVGHEWAHPLDEATERIYQEDIFKTVAHEIAHFPAKQRQAILIDLANRMCFDGELTPLQSAFLEEGIELQHCQRPLPTDARGRNQYLSLLNHAYKRVAHLPDVQDFIKETPRTNAIPTIKNL